MEFMDEDFLLALELQEQLDKESWQPSPQPTVKPNSTLSIVDESWEYIDPNPDIRELFLQFNNEFFWGRLAGIEVKWSQRMTLCAGLCVYEGRGGLCSVRLSLPLLKLRPRKDLVETLLHEMIHAYLFVTDNNKDHDGHGPEFHKHMYRINNATGTKISVYHNFHDEVDQYRQHWWRCNGPCQNRKPFFGYVKRAMNRAPSERDPWWKDHKRSCNGTYIKIKEPEGYGKKKSKEKSEKSDKVKSSQIGKSETGGKKGNPDIRSFLGKGQVLHSGKPQQKVIINGVLTTSVKSDNKSDVNVTKFCSSSSGKENEDSVTKPRTSVSAISTSGKISDKELLRQQKLAELMLSDSDDDDLILCDQPEPGRSSDNDVIITSSKGIISETSSTFNKMESNTINSTELRRQSEMSFESGRESHITNTPRISIKGENNDALSNSTESYKSETNVSIYNSKQSGINVTSKSSSNDVASKVRSVWANKQFGSSLKPLDPKADSLNFIPNKEKGNSSNKRLSKDDSNGHNILGVKSSNKRLSGDDLSGSRKKLKHESGQGFKINDMFSKIPTMQNESSESSLASCPVCNKYVPSSEINQHLDICLGIC